MMNKPCSFKNCAGPQACILSAVSPCPHYEHVTEPRPLGSRSRRVSSRIGFVAVDAPPPQKRGVIARLLGR